MLILRVQFLVLLYKVYRAEMPVIQTTAAISLTEIVQCLKCVVLKITNERYRKNDALIF